MTQYGGAIFNDKCSCGRKAQMPTGLSVNRFMAQQLRKQKHTIQAKCSKCGDVEVEFKRFTE